MPIDWQFAGLTDTHPVKTSGWRVPALVELEGNRLIWRWVDGDRIAKVVRVRRGFVESFVELADAGPEAIGAYARQWGVLMICEHGIPAGHSWPRVSVMDALNGLADVTWCHPCGWPDACWESVGAWYVLAQQARAMVNVASALHLEQPARRGDWHSVVMRTWRGNDWGDPSLDALNKAKNAIHARAFLEESVNRWLAWGAVQPVLAWSGGKDPTIELEGFGLFGALAAELLALVSHRGWAVCSACGRQYDIRGRRPNPNRRNYCPDCRSSGVSSRDSSRDFRRRQAARQQKERER